MGRLSLCGLGIIWPLRPFGQELAELATNFEIDGDTMSLMHAEPLLLVASNRDQHCPCKNR